MERQLETRLEMLPINKQIGYFSDAYCADWAYGKSYLIKKITANVLGKKIDNGYYTLDDAVTIAKALFYDSGNNIYHMK